MSPFDRLESDFRAEFSAMPTPVDPMAVDVTPETLADRETVAATRAHIETWKRNRHAITPTDRGE